MPALRWTPAYVALGSNLADPARQLVVAGKALARIPGTRVAAISRRYRNPPLGVLEQPDFVNAVAGLLTTLSPAELLVELKAIEQRQGRDAGGGRWGPRLIDLDLLMHGQSRCQEARLVLPHPGMAQRNFVLFPLLEIAPWIEIPGAGPAAELARSLDAGTLVPVD